MAHFRPEEEPMKVTDLIASRKEIYSVQDDATVHDAARYLRDRGVRSAGVCSKDGKLVGVLSQSDISDKVAAENKCPAWMRVSEIMTPELVTVPPDAPLDACLKLMEQFGIFHLLVVDEKDRFHGMISVADLLTVIASDEKARADLLEDLIFPKR
jgi:CBS domain-containing protein